MMFDLASSLVLLWAALCVCGCLQRQSTAAFRPVRSASSESQQSHTFAFFKHQDHFLYPNKKMNFGPDSQPCTCPHCHASVHTRIKNESTTKTHLFALLCCIICCPFFWVPYCCDSCQATNHYCPNCNNFLGTYAS